MAGGSLVRVIRHVRPLPQQPPEGERGPATGGRAPDSGLAARPRPKPLPVTAPRRRKMGGPVRARTWIPAGCLVAVCLAVVPVLAQEQTGSIEGVVRDPQGAVLPGATVEARDLTVGSVLAVIADGSGSFRFAALAPGYYGIAASLDGFQLARFERVEVLLGQIKRLDFTLSLAGLEETVNVSAASLLVDVKQSARGFSLRRDQLEYLPRGLDYTTVVQLLPGTNQEPKPCRAPRQGREDAGSDNGGFCQLQRPLMLPIVYTYSGHPTCCAVALCNIEILERERLVERAAAAGARLLEKLRGLEGMDGVGHVRGLGLMAAVEVVADKATKQQVPAAFGLAQKLTDALLDRGLYTRVALDCICLAPPLVTSDALIDRIADTVRDAIPAVLSTVVTHQ